MPPRSWEFRVQDMQAAIARIREYTTGLTLTEFVETTQVSDAVLYNLTVIGEAAGHLPDEAKQLAPDAPWVDVIGMRNILIHEYFGVSLEIVWRTLTHDLPELERSLQKLVSG